MEWKPAYWSIKGNDASAQEPQGDSPAKHQVQNLDKREFWAVEIPVGTRPDMCRGCSAHEDPRCSGVSQTLEEPMTVAVYERSKQGGFELGLGKKIHDWVIDVGNCRPRDAGSAVPGDKIDAFAPKSAGDIHELYQARLQK
jgi:hypothetical protein